MTSRRGLAGSRYPSAAEHPSLMTHKASSPSPVTVGTEVRQLRKQVQELQIEQENQVNLEYESNKTFTMLTTQLQSLRKGFRILSEAVIKEVDTIHVEVTNMSRQHTEHIDALHRKMATVQLQVAELQAHRETWPQQVEEQLETLHKTAAAVERETQRQGKLQDQLRRDMGEWQHRMEEGQAKVHLEMRHVERGLEERVSAVQIEMGMLKDETARQLHSTGKQVATAEKMTQGNLEDLEETLSLRLDQWEARVLQAMDLEPVHQRLTEAHKQSQEQLASLRKEQAQVKQIMEGTVGELQVLGVQHRSMVDVSNHLRQLASQLSSRMDTLAAATSPAGISQAIRETGQWAPLAVASQMQRQQEEMQQALDNLRWELSHRGQATTVSVPAVPVSTGFHPLARTLHQGWQ